MVQKKNPQRTVSLSVLRQLDEKPVHKLTHPFAGLIRCPKVTIIISSS